MFKKLVKLINVLKRKNILRFFYSQYYFGYLKDIGWFESFEAKKPLDKEGKPLPWVTYPFIEFIKPRLNNVQTLFEFGSGNSTLFYSSFIKEVHSVEHDKTWFENIKLAVPQNVYLKYQKLEYGEDYCKSSLGRKYDLIIVDGRDRANCIYQSVASLTNHGCIVLDDSERKRYQEAIKWLTETHRFKKIDFWGISPGLFYLKNTTIFYRAENILDI